MDRLRRLESDGQDCLSASAAGAEDGRGGFEGVGGFHGNDHVARGDRVQFQATGGTARQATFVLKADGKFAGKMTAGKYTYFFNELQGKAAAHSALPAAFRQGSMERQIEVKAGQPLDLKVQ